MKPILEIKNISKRFRISHETAPYLSLRDSFTGLFSKSKTSKEDFYALRDVSLDVMPGDTIGIIGKNGAGKSTLLKILSRITPPSSGSIICRGRMASLLEVGTGFHPELTGRENVFFNGSILGMKRTEIHKNFDAIVDFAGIEKFLDTPLKHYSSGMQLRLAFAVAAFLENEILVIDEVLAVGDAEFQKKCMGKMEEVSKSGRTILFVSHQLGTVAQLCKNSILLEQGSVAANGHSKEVIDTYISKDGDEAFKLPPVGLLKQSSKEMHFTEITTTDEHGVARNVFGHNATVQVKMKIKIDTVVKGVKVGLGLNNMYNNRVFTIFSYLDYSSMKDQMISLNIQLPIGLIAPNKYHFSAALYIFDNRFIDIIDNVCKITILDEGSMYAAWEGINYGDVMVHCNWKYE
jgi:lipopolysaccharide transport system ATP-binding protein